MSSFPLKASSHSALGASGQNASLVLSEHGNVKDNRPHAGIINRPTTGDSGVTGSFPWNTTVPPTSTGQAAAVSEGGSH